MEPLIKIETIPIEIKYTEKEPQKSSAAVTAEISVSQQDGLQSIRSNPIQIPIQDYFETSSTFNWDHPTYTATADYGEDGNLKLNIQMEDEASRAIRFQQSARSIDFIANRVSATTQGNNSTASMQISFNMRGLTDQTTVENNVNTQFYPPDLELVVTQKPDVVITYVGGPIYFPRSADPDYKPIEGAGPIYFPESSDPDYKPVPGVGPVYFPASADPDYEPVEGDGPIYFPASADPDYEPVEGDGPIYVPRSADPDYDPTSKIGVTKNAVKLDQSV